MTTLLMASLLAANTAVFADTHHDNADKPFFQVTQTDTVTAEVTAINHETREVELLRADGEEIAITVSEEARNLDQVSVGDIVIARYEETMSVRVMPNEGREPARTGSKSIERSKKGDMPGMTADDTQVVTATVEAIDIERNTFRLKGPDGQIEEYQARNPENLEKAEVGDLVVMTTSHAVAIAVEPGRRQ